MSLLPKLPAVLLLACLATALPAAQTPPAAAAPKKLPFTATSPYHNIRVEDHDGFRILYFDDTNESRMNVADPTTGQFEYTEYFHMVWLWNQNIKNVLMIGLGGSSTQRGFVNYYPGVKVESVEIDPVVGQVARDYFHYVENDRQKLNILDGRVFLRRSTEKYDAILFDAYTQGRYGASIPPHMVTKEFFQIVKDHLTPNGVLAYNLISVLQGYNTDIVAAMFHTMKEIFPQVYFFSAESSANLVLIATMSKDRATQESLLKIATPLVESKKLPLPNYLARIKRFVDVAPTNYLATPVFTDDFAPVEGMMRPSAGVGNTTAPAPRN